MIKSQLIKILWLFSFSFLFFLYFSKFFSIPIMFEYREILDSYVSSCVNKYHGIISVFGDKKQNTGVNLLSFVFPSGDNLRFTGYFVFNFNMKYCMISAKCHNYFQLSLIFIGALAGVAHLRQVTRSIFIATISAVAWVASWPVFFAAFWQSTQYDKLALIFILACLCCSLFALRTSSHARRVLAIIACTLFLILAVNSKELAFSLLFIIPAQVILLADTGTKGWVRRSAFVAAPPLIFLVFYISVYVLRMPMEWRSHTESGDMIANTRIFFSYMFGLNEENRITQAMMLLALIACILFGARFIKNVARMIVMRSFRMDAAIAQQTYFLIAFVCLFSLIARLKYTAPYYMYVPLMFALPFIIMSLLRNFYWRYVGCAAIVIFMALRLLNTRFMFDDDTYSGQILADANMASRNYAIIRAMEARHRPSQYNLVIEGQPAADVYLFHKAHGEIDNDLSSAIFEEPGHTRVIVSYGTPPTPRVPGSTIIYLSQKLEILRVEE